MAFTAPSPVTDDTASSPQGVTVRSPSSAAEHRSLNAVTQWFDTNAVAAGEDADAERIDWLRVIPFIGMHLACLGVIWVGISWTALAVAAALYALRMFALTGFYHRYFS